MKKLLMFGAVVMWLSFPMASFGAMGQMTPKSEDIEVQFFGSVKCFPTFMSDLDFNKDNTSLDFILDENGLMASHDIRNEVRLGWTGKGSNWDFLAILEADFNLDKNNADRGATAAGVPGLDLGMTGEDFGVEKLNLSYNFGSYSVKTGWNTRFLDIMTGGLLYGDDHPYIGLEGKSGDFSWEFLYIIVQDEAAALTPRINDWRGYTLKGIHKTKDGFVISPFYAYSDNSDTDNNANAKVHYFGFEAYGKSGKLTPRMEFVYATGETDPHAAGGTEYDISAFAAYASLDMEISPQSNAYFGVTYMTGDDNANDTDIDAFNGITNIARYTPTFGMENAIIYRYVPALGTHLYSNNFATLGGTSPGYGGISNSSTGDSPGLISYGLGVKGTSGKLSYKAQVLFMQFEEEGAIEGHYGTSIDDEVGTEYDLLLTYKYSNHFSLGNCLSIFDPGDAVKDIRGADYDDMGILDTVELTWVW